MRVDEVGRCDVVTVREGVSVREVAHLLRARNAGEAVVVRYRDGKERPVGIITERDIVYETIAVDVEPDALIAGDIMSRELISVPCAADFVTAVRTMAVEGVRRLPIVDAGGELVAMLSLDDVIEELAGQMEDLLQLLAQERRPWARRGNSWPGRVVAPAASPAQEWLRRRDAAP